MSHEAPNGKATVSLILQGAAFLVLVVAPLIIMYSKLNSLEIMVTERLGEVETQFRAADEYRNVMLATQMRYIGLLWHKAYGEPFPTETYFPTISRK